MGGAIGEVSSWHLICKDWGAVLSRHNVKGFHSSDYNTRHGEYEDWDDEHRHRFIDDLFDIMGNRDVRGMAYVMEKRDYEEAVKVYSNIQMSPYKFLAYACAVQTGRLTKIEKNMSPIEVVFEAGQPFYSHAMGELLNDLGLELTQEEVGISAITVQRKSGVIPFQVADLIIYGYSRPIYALSTKSQASQDIRREN